MKYLFTLLSITILVSYTSASNVIDEYIKSINADSNNRFFTQLVADLDKDGLDDYICIYKHIGSEENGVYTEQTHCTYLLSSNNYQVVDQPYFSMPRKLTKENLNKEARYTPRSILVTAKGFEIIVLDNMRSERFYARRISFRYNNQQADFEVYQDGGYGVFDKKKTYLPANEISSNTISLNNWHEWYYATLLPSKSNILKRNIKEVNTEQQFIEAIGDSATIILKDNKIYDISSANVKSILQKRTLSHIKTGTISMEMGKAYNDTAWWIEGVKDLAIVGINSTLTSNVPDDNTLWINNSNKVSLINISVTHNDVQAIPSWNLCISNTQELDMYNCRSVASGSCGLFLFNVQNIYAEQSYFGNQTNFGLLGRKIKDTQFDACHFFDVHLRPIQLEEALDVSFNNCRIYDNQYFYLILFRPNFEKNNITFRNCVEYNNRAKYSDDSVKIVVEGFDQINEMDGRFDINSGMVQYTTK